MTEREGFSGIGIALAFFGGALTGATMALLLAPKSGRETRQELKDLAETGREKVAKVPQALKEAYSQATEVAKDAFVGAYNETGIRAH